MNIFSRFKKLFNPIDLTEGTIWKTILLFMTPIVLSYLFQQIYTLTDTIICGQNLSANEVAGVNNSNSITFLALQFAMGLPAGFSVIVSKKIGEKNELDARKSILVQLIFGFLIGAIMTLVFIFLIKPILTWMNINPSSIDVNADEIYNSAYIYTLIIIIGTLPVLFYNIALGVLRAIGDSFIPFLFLVFSTILNVGLDLLFIVILKWAVIGAAVATVLAQFIAAVGCFIYIFARYKNLRLQKQDFHFSFKYVLDHLKLGLPLAFQFSVLGIGIIVMQASVVAFDKTAAGIMVDLTPATNGIGAGYKLNNFLMCLLNALGTAMLSYCGQNYGAKKYERIIKGVNQGIIIGFIMCIFILLVGMLLTINGTYIYIFLKADKVNADVIKYGNIYLYTILPLYFLLMFLFIFRNSLQGIEKPLWPFLAGIGELVGRILVCTFLPSVINNGPINSSASDLAFVMVALADPMAWLFADIILMIPGYIYIYKNYKRKYELVRKLHI